MIKKIFSIFDAKAAAFNDPVFLPNQAIAERSFRLAANDPQSFIGQCPTDYTLFCLGEWNDDTGRLELYDTPQAIGLATNYKDTGK